jgi:hypothetical protein
MRGAYLSTGATLQSEYRSFSAFYHMDRGRCFGISHWIFVTNSFNLISVFMFITTFLSTYRPCSKEVETQKKIKFSDGSSCTSRSQWPRGFRHEIFSLSRILESWVRIPLKAWMSVCVYSVFVSLGV